MAVHEVFAYLCVDDAVDAIAFYQRAFGATEKMRLVEPGGRIGHAEIDLDGTTVMLADEFPEIGVRSPASIGGSAVTIHLHVDDADAVVDSAEKAGATVEMPRTDMFYGERTAVLHDPFGHRWNIGHTIEEVSPRRCSGATPRWWKSRSSPRRVPSQARPISR